MGSLFRRETEFDVAVKVAQTYKGAFEESRSHGDAILLTSKQFLSPEPLREEVLEKLPPDRCLKHLVTWILKCKFHGGGPMLSHMFPTPEQQARLDRIEDAASRVCRCSSMLCKCQDKDEYLFEKQSLSGTNLNQQGESSTSDSIKSEPYSKRPTDLKGRLREIKELLDEGLISQEDYKKKKAELLSDF